MKHLFVPHELAMLAKDKDFKEQCMAVYKTVLGGGEPELIVTIRQPNTIGIPEHFYLQVPTHQQLVDWFREKHTIDIYYIPPIGWQIQLYDKPLTVKTFQGEYYEALTAALTEAFKLI